MTQINVWQHFQMVGFIQPIRSHPPTGTLHENSRILEEFGDQHGDPVLFGSNRINPIGIYPATILVSSADHSFKSPQPAHSANSE